MVHFYTGQSGPLEESQGQIKRSLHRGQYQHEKGKSEPQMIGAAIAKSGITTRRRCVCQIVCRDPFVCRWRVVLQTPASSFPVAGCIDRAEGRITPSVATPVPSVRRYSGRSGMPGRMLAPKVNLGCTKRPLLIRTKGYEPVSGIRILGPLCAFNYRG